MKKSYVIVGAGSRALEMFARPLINEFSDVAALVGICDPNPERARFLIGAACPGTPFFADFDAMLNVCTPDVVIVSTVDAYHDEYIVRALDFGCGAITEKPMTIDDYKCNAILDAERRNNRKIRVTFNARYSPLARRLRELLSGDGVCAGGVSGGCIEGGNSVGGRVGESGVGGCSGCGGCIGDIYHINMEWLLDTSHGADYFRRWHRQKKNSGGLLVHKATHHFDMINWWIGQVPDVVYASGTRRFYGPTRENRGTRCEDCPHNNTCEYAFNLSADPVMQGLYFEPERIDGYHRDGCIFSPDINIEDNMALTVKYKNGALLTYSLIAYSPYEGYRVTFSGSGGRVEVETFASGLYADQPDDIIKIYNRRNEEQVITVPKAAGMHGGADERLREMLFRPDVPDPLNQLASSEAGVLSAMIGICANKSIRDGLPHRIDDYIRW